MWDQESKNYTKRVVDRTMLVPSMGHCCTRRIVRSSVYSSSGILVYVFWFIFNTVLYRLQLVHRVQQVFGTACLSLQFGEMVSAASNWWIFRETHILETRRRSTFQNYELAAGSGKESTATSTATLSVELTNKSDRLVCCAANPEIPILREPRQISFSLKWTIHRVTSTEQEIPTDYCYPIVLSYSCL